MPRMGGCWIVAALLGVTAVAQEPKFEVTSVKPQNLPFSVVVIDSVQQPTEN